MTPIDDAADIESLWLDPTTPLGIPKPGKFDLEKFRVKPPEPVQLDLFEWADQQDLLDSPTYEMGPPSSPPVISGLGDEDAATTMVEWFFANFENPAENTPWDEGEYVYIWGGPHEAREELEDAFPGVTESAFDLATEEIEGDGWDWAPSQNRMRPEIAPTLSEYSSLKELVLASIRRRYKACPPVLEEVTKLLEKLWGDTFTPDAVRSYTALFHLDQTGHWPEGFWEGQRHG